MQTKVKDFSYPEKYQDSFMEFFDTYQSSGSVKVTQEPIKQYLSLQEHRDVSVQHLNCCDWTAGKNCIFPMSTPKVRTLDSEDWSALRSVYQPYRELWFTAMPDVKECYCSSQLDRT